MGLEDTANSPQTMEAPSLLLSAKRSNEAYRSTIYEKINMRKGRPLECVLTAKSEVTRLVLMQRAGFSPMF